MPVETQTPAATVTATPTSTVVETAPVQAVVHPPVQQPPVEPTKVEIPIEQLKSYMDAQSRLALIETQRLQETAAAQQEQAKVLFQKGELQNALDLMKKQREDDLEVERTKRIQVETRMKESAIDTELAKALIGQTFASNKARDAFLRQVRTELVADDSTGVLAVRNAKFQSVHEIVNRELADPENAFLLSARTQGGTATPSSTTSAPPISTVTTPITDEPINMSDAIVKQVAWNKQQTYAQDPRAHKGFGLKPIAR